MEKFKCKSVRLCRYLYSLGFNKESKYDKNENEYWLFEKSNELQKSLDFFFVMRKEIMNKKTGANENEIYRGNEKERIRKK